jgi:ATP-dependent RNA helicase DHX29
LELNSKLSSQVLELALELEIPAKKGLDEPEDKVIGRLAITYGVLRRLGFSEDRVQECLRTINGIELDEAYDWVNI